MRAGHARRGHKRRLSVSRDSLPRASPSMRAPTPSGRRARVYILRYPVSTGARHRRIVGAGSGVRQRVHAERNLGLCELGALHVLPSNVSRSVAACIVLSNSSLAGSSANHPSAPRVRNCRQGACAPLTRMYQTPARNKLPCRSDTGAEILAFGGRTHTVPRGC